MLGGTIRLESEKGKGSRFTVEIPMQTAEELPEQINQTQIHHDRTFHDVIAIDNDEVLAPYVERNVCPRRNTLRYLHRCCGTDGTDTKKGIQPASDGSEYAGYKRFRAVGTATHLQRWQFKDIPVVVTTASGSCSKEELMERGFSDCLLKPFSISELMEVSDKCAMKGNKNEKPDFTSLLSYGNESVMLEKLITETEKEMQSVRMQNNGKTFRNWTP